jgi:hypothetical protein
MDAFRVLDEGFVMLKWTQLFVLAAIFIAPRAADAQSGSLTPLDRYEIQQQISRSCHGWDSAADNGNLYARAFTTDGIAVDANGRTYQGREQLAAYARQNPDGKKGPTFVSHFLMSTVIDPAPGGTAIARSYVMVTTTTATLPSPQPVRGPVTDGGMFVDEVVKTPEGWRIRKRTFQRAGTPIQIAAARSQQ